MHCSVLNHLKHSNHLLLALFINSYFYSHSLHDGQTSFCACHFLHFTHIHSTTSTSSLLSLHSFSSFLVHGMYSLRLHHILRSLHSLHPPQFTPFARFTSSMHHIRFVIPLTIHDSLPSLHTHISFIAFTSLRLLYSLNSLEILTIWYVYFFSSIHFALHPGRSMAALVRFSLSYPRLTLSVCIPFWG